MHTHIHTRKAYNRVSLYLSLGECACVCNKRRRGHYLNTAITHIIRTHTIASEHRCVFVRSLNFDCCRLCFSFRTLPNRTRNTYSHTYRDAQVWASQQTSKQTQRIGIKTNDVRKTTPKITLKFKWFTNNKNKIDCIKWLWLS